MATKLVFYCKYLIKIVFFNSNLKLDIVRERRTFKGMLFHVSGPACLIDLCANLVTGLNRCMSVEILVGYLCIAEFNLKILSNVSGS